MSMIVLCSAHGSPGVTTAALALAGTWPQDRRCLVIEADPSGGVIAARYGLADTPGLSSLAAVARQGLNDETVWSHVQSLPGGVPALLGPPSGDEAHAVLRDVAGVLGGWCAAQDDVDIIVDCGRTWSASPTTGMLASADVVLLLARPSLDQLRPAGARLASLETSEARARMLLVGTSPYGAGEVSATMGVEVGGVIAWDPRTAAVLEGTRGSVRDLRRSPLVRSAATLTDRLTGPDASDAGEDTEARVGEFDMVEEVSG